MQRIIKNAQLVDESWHLLPKDATLDGISNCDIHEQLSLLPVPSGTGPYRGPRRFRIGRRIQI